MDANGGAMVDRILTKCADSACAGGAFDVPGCSRMFAPGGKARDIMRHGATRRDVFNSHTRRAKTNPCFSTNVSGVSLAGDRVALTAEPHSA
jgi:hypothetical protein